MRRLTTLMAKKAAIRSSVFFAVLSAFLALGALDCYGAIILHVDTGNSVGHQAKGIPGVLTPDGHAVTSITNQASAFAALNGPLSAYDLVIWDNWSNANSLEIANLTNFVQSGGRLLAVGYDSIFQPGMASLLGGTSVSDTVLAGNVLNSVVNQSNSLTTGVVDIRGLTPVGVTSSGPDTGNRDLDSLNGLGSGTTAVVTSVYGNHWTLRQLGSGEVAFVSTPYGFDFQTNPVYAGALRNFAASADIQAVTPEPATLAVWSGLGIFGLVAARRDSPGKRRAGSRLPPTRAFRLW